MISDCHGRCTARLSLLITLVLAASLHAGPVTVIDFEDEEPGTTSRIVFAGFQLDGSPSMLVTPSSGSGANSNGTQFLRDIDNAPLMLNRRYPDNMFDLISFDLGEGNSDVGFFATQLFVTGFHTDGTISERVIELDLIVPDFQTVALDGMTDLVEVTFASDSQTGFSLDNIVVVPEPSVLLLIVAGGCVVLMRRPRRAPMILLVLLTAFVSEPRCA